MLDVADNPVVFPPTRAAAIDRLRAFLPRAGEAYASGRNHDLGPGEAATVSRLSPYLRHRLILEEEVLRPAVVRHGLRLSARFVGEVMWRTYWKGWLDLRPEPWRRYEVDLTKAVEALGADPALADRYAAAVAGETGIDAFDAFAAELAATGSLHNHARMWFASIWIFTLKLPWVLGADLFLRHLADADPASNTLSWRWVAGLQTPGKTYLATAENIAAFTGGRFRPTGLAGTATALEEAPLPPPRGLPPADLTPPDLSATAGAPRLRPADAVGLLVTEEDLAPESLGLDPAVVAYVAGTIHPAARARAGVPRAGDPPIGAIARAFLDGAMTDALARAGAAHPLAATERLADGAAPEAVAAWADRSGLEAVVTAYAPVGPVADWLEAVEAALAETGIPLLRVRRAWDTRAHPLATKGYFAFREAIPRLLEQAGIRPA